MAVVQNSLLRKTSYNERKSISYHQN